MAGLDFTEIPSGYSDPGRDIFRLFAKDFLIMLGFRLVPDRSNDPGRDLVVEEKRVGIAGETVIRWMVSCRHHAHSGAPVAPAEEQYLHDRLRIQGCSAFLGFYSTPPSPALTSKLEAGTGILEFQIFDPTRMEGALLSSAEGLALARGYFPRSAPLVWRPEHFVSSGMFQKPIDLQCASCGKSLLRPEPSGIVVLWQEGASKEVGNTRRIERVHWCCKGVCDRKLAFSLQAKGLQPSWEEIPDLTVPTTYISWTLETITDIFENGRYSREAFESIKELLLNLFPLVSRHLTGQERKRMQGFRLTPTAFGGFGSDG